MHVFEGDTLNDVYDDMFRAVALGSKRSARGKETLEIRPVVLHLTRSYASRFLIIPNRGINYAFAIAEVLWILGGRGDTDFISFYNKRMLDYADTQQYFNGSYGRRLRSYDYDEWPSFAIRHYDNSEVPNFSRMNRDDNVRRLFHSGVEFDQLSIVVSKIKEDIDTRQAVALIWDARKDNFIKSKDYPCNVLLMFKVVDGKLDMSVIRRSNDIIWGLPYNVIQFTSIHEYVAGKLCIPIGDYYEYIDSLHVYTKEYEAVYNKMMEKLVHRPDMYPSEHTRELFTAYYFENVTEFVPIDYDGFLHKFFTAESEWRKSMWDLNTLGKYFMTINHKMWRHFVAFLAAFHLYKASRDVDALTVLSMLPEMLAVMAMESMPKLKGKIMQYGMVSESTIKEWSL
jgi:thymidylate synthase